MFFVVVLFKGAKEGRKANENARAMGITVIIITNVFRIILFSFYFQIDIGARYENFMRIRIIKTKKKNKKRNIHTLNLDAIPVV